MREIGAVFTDADVARAYQYRPPLPPETFNALAELLVLPRALLDLGAGSGAVARHSLGFADRVDAVDPSAAMIEQGRRLEHGIDPRIRWIVGTAEEAPLDPPYGLATAGASLHWMDLDRLMPRLVVALAPGARLAVLETVEEPIGDPTWESEGREIAGRYGEPGHDQDGPEFLADVEAKGHFVREGERRTAPVRFRRTIDEYLEWQHSKTTLARVRIGARAREYDADMRQMFARRGLSSLEFDVIGLIVYGHPARR